MEVLVNLEDGKLIIQNALDAKNVYMLVCVDY